MNYLYATFFYNPIGCFTQLEKINKQTNLLMKPMSRNIRRPFGFLWANFTFSGKASVQQETYEIWKFRRKEVL